MVAETLNTSLNRWDIPGYEVKRTLPAPPGERICECCRIGTSTPLLARGMTLTELQHTTGAAFLHEMDLLLQLPPHLSLKEETRIRTPDTLWVIFEHFSGKPLRQLLQSTRPDMEQTLNITLEVARQLARVHAAKIIHSALSPNTLLWHDIPPPNLHSSLSKTNTTAPDGRYDQNGQVRLIGFRRAQIFKGGRIPIAECPASLSELTYISPEQSGRMNRSIDHRSDLYALGVILYELLNGYPPFTGQNRLELIHAHLARAPHWEEICLSRLPEMLIRIAQKLLNKNPEDRYQSVEGVVADLEICLDQWTHHHALTLFEPGQSDPCRFFRLSQKIYGRTSEIAGLNQAFKTVCKGPSQVVLISGYSGIGKTTLVRELFLPMMDRRARYITGKFDQFQRHIPYRALSEAFGELITDLYALKNEELEHWKSKIVKTLDDDLLLVASVLPALSSLLGRTPHATQGLKVAGDQHEKLKLAFARLMSLFCSSAHPLVIFLDDLQWIDFATVSLLEWLFCNQNISHCLFIGAFRDNEVDSTHRIAQMIRHLQKQKSAPLSIKLKPLSRSDITELIADTLHHTQNNVLDLADIVIKQTEGNPFYVESLLTERYQEHLIWFNTTTQSWDWDCQQIEQCPVSEDVVDLMIRKMERLAPESQRLLSIASCIGNRFSVAFLAHLSELDAPLVHHAVQEALSLGFLVSYQKPPSNEEDLSHETTISDGYRFAHDKIQQAAFSLIPKKEYPAIHTRIGRALLSSYHPDVSTEFVFNMVNHLNAGDLSLLNAQQQADLIELNREAGDRAMRVSAFDAGLDYFRQALELAIQQKLPWWQNPTHQVQLYTELAQAAYMCTHFDDMEHYCQSVIALTPDIEQLIPVYELQIQAHTSLNHLSDALELALMVLEKLGEPFPPTPVDSDFEQARHEVERLLEGRSVADLANLPDMTDPRKLAAMRILSSASGAALCKRAALHPLFVARRILLSLNFGHAPETTFAYASFGLVLVAKLRDYELAWQFSQLCYATQHRFPDKKLNNRANYVSIMSVEHWKRPLRECTTRLQECYRVAVELGDSDFVGFTAYNLGYQLFPCASGLEEFTSNLTALMTTLVKLKQIRWNNLLAMLQFTAHQLTGEETSRSITDHFGQEQVDQWYASQGEEALIFALHTNQLIVDLHYGRVQPAWEAANQAHAALCYEVQALRALPLFQFYEGVCHFLRLLESPAPLSASPDTQITADFLQHCRTHFDQLRQMCPDNHHHHFLIFKAACQWLQKEQKQAIELLSQACQFAIRMQYWGDAGLICQIQARCYQSLRYEDEAAESLAQASQYYTEWGATGVVKALDQTAFLPSPSNVVPPRNPQSKTGTPGSQDPLHQAPSPQNLDYETVIQVLQQISSTISLKPLIELLLTAMLENAGAQRVVLLIGDKELLDVYGALDVKTEVSHPFPCALESYSALPQNLIRFVARTRDYVRMDDVRIEGRKYRDSYLDQSHLRSALCLPIIREERAIGVVYFENNASTAIFTDQRIQVLSLIASQAAISIENARLLDEQKQIKLDLQSALDKNRALLSAIPDLIFLFDRRCTFLDCHPKQKMALHFRDPDHIIGKQVDEVLSPSQAQLVHRAVNEVLGSEQPATYSFSVQLRDETAHYESRFAQCGEELVLVIVRDITDRVHAAEEHERLQGQLMLTNKMESVGRLAGGIAHDFNNLLGIIFGYIDLSMVSTQEKKVSEYLEKTSQAIDRAKHLTAQLLTFSKGGTPVKKKAALIPFIHDTIEFALSGSAVSCDFEIQEHLDCCEYDENLLAQVLDNIVINASQAMQGKGRIEVRAANEHLESSYSNELPAGEYVRISLRDSGAGMERKVMDKIFDPFFTTKPTGHGLGLATCYSIIRQHHGLIEVESTPGKGTTFHLLLPACHERETTLESTSQHDHTGKGTIVIMDDEEAILDVIGQMVESFGYHAVLKKEGAEVMHYIETCPHRDEIKGMIFDLTIPGKMGGLETIAAIRKLDTTLPVFVASGYADDPAMSNPAEYGFTASIRKPFVTQDLARLFNAAGVT